MGIPHPSPIRQSTKLLGHVGKNLPMDESLAVEKSMFA
jgi:hypothetical protein